MKILISRVSPDQTIGGAELSARDITRSLNKLGHKTYLATNQPKTLVTKNTASANVLSTHRWIYKLHLPTLLRLLLLVPYYKYLILRLKPDVISPQSRDDQVLFTFLGKLFNLPVVWRDPGDLCPQLRYPIKGPAQKFNRWLQKCAIARADHIFTLNQDDRQFLIDHIRGLKTQQVSVIGSNINFSDYIVKRQKPDQITIGVVSRLDEHKGVQYVIEAFSALQKKHKNNLRLVIAGEGPYKDELESIAKNIVGIEFVGTKKNISSIYNSVDIFVQASDFEGWGRTIKEAMYFGLSIVGSNIGGIKAQIKDGETGLLSGVKDSKSIQLQLDKLISSEGLRKQLGKNAKNQALTDGDWTNTVSKQILPLFVQEKRKKQFKIRIDGSAFLDYGNISGVGYYSKMLASALNNTSKTLLASGPLEGKNRATRLGNKVYRKLASFGVAPYFDIFRRRVDATIFPNFSRWPTLKSNITATVIHDLTYLRYPEYTQHQNLPHLRRVVPRSLKKSDFTIAVSEAVKSELVQEFGISKERIVVTNIPPRENFFEPSSVDIRKIYSIPTKRYILFVGNLEPRKNLSTLLDAYLSLDNNIQEDTSLIIAGGTGWANQDFINKIDKFSKQYPNIKRIGYVNDDHIAALFQQADVFVLPSLYEGFGMPVLEAMAAKTVVVSSDIPSIREAGGEAAIYCKPSSVPGLKIALDKALMDDKLRQEMLSRFEANLSRFSWQYNADKIVSKIEELS